MGNSFSIRNLNWRVAWLTVIFLVGYFALGEIFFSLDSVRSLLTGPRIGSRHTQFQDQIARLEKLTREGESIDCIFLGNSMVWLGINPLVVNDAFGRATGSEIHCFNFGVSALPSSGAGEIASVLVKKYHPKVLLYGTFARDYAVPFDAEDSTVISNTPWLKYENGMFNLQGWLYSHSSLYQYQGHMHDLLYQRDLENVIPPKDTPRYKAYGLDPKFDFRLDVTKSPDYEDVGNKEMLKWLHSFEIQQENLDGLEQILHQSEHGVEVVVIEMPFNENVYEFFANGAQDYQTYIQQVDSITLSSHAQFWRKADQPVFTSDDWWDFFHLNLQGADIFSEWVGNHLADTYREGGLDLSPHSLR